MTGEMTALELKSVASYEIAAVSEHRLTQSI